MKSVAIQNLLEQFNAYVDASTEVDLYVANVTHGPALDLVLRAASDDDRAIRVMTSLAGGHHEPIALDRLAAIGCCRLLPIVTGTAYGGGLLRVKTADGELMWLGLPGLTRRGFLIDEGLVVETVVEPALTDWFDTRWATARPLGDDAVPTGAEEWSLPPLDPLVPIGGGSGFDHPYQILEYGDVTDWDSYVVALQRADAYRRGRGETGGIYDEFRSVSRGLDAGRAVIVACDWNEPMSDQQAEALMGCKADGVDGYVMLGGSKKRTIAKAYMMGSDAEDTDMRRLIQAELRGLADLPVDRVIDEAAEILKRMETVSGIDAMTVTRLMSLMRPDVCVAVHNGSGRGYGSFSNLPQTPISLAKPKNYHALLTHLSETPWIDCAAPDQPFERYLWDRRAAMMEVLMLGWES